MIKDPNNQFFDNPFLYVTIESQISQKVEVYIHKPCIDIVKPKNLFDDEKKEPL